MRYFIYGEELTAVEDPKQAEKFRQAGWQEVTDQQFCDAWRARDLRRLPQLKREQERERGRG